MRITLNDIELKALQAEADSLKGAFELSTKTAAKKTKYSTDFLKVLDKYAKICVSKKPIK